MIICLVSIAEPVTQCLKKIQGSHEKKDPHEKETWNAMASVYSNDSVNLSLKKLMVIFLYKSILLIGNKTKHLRTVVRKVRINFDTQGYKASFIPHSMPHKWCGEVWKPGNKWRILAPGLAHSGSTGSPSSQWLFS